MKATSHSIQFLLLFLSLFLFACGEERANQTPTELSPTEVALEATEASFHVVKLNGSNYEMGVQHGKQLKAEIHEMVKLWEEDIELNYQLPAEEFTSKFLAATHYVDAIKKWTPHLYEEIKGISKGTGIELNKIMMYQLVDEMWNNGGVVFAPHHCSSIGVDNRSSGGLVNYIAQNVDVTPFYHKYQVLLQIEDETTQSLKYVVTVPGIIGVNGLNQHVGVNVNTLMDLQLSATGLPVCCVVRGVLDQDSFEGAEAFLREIEHASGQNYMLGSKEGVASFECSAAKVVAFWPDSTHRYTFHANNSHANDSYQPEYINYLRDSLQLTHEEYIKDQGRFESLKARIMGNETIELETLKETLQSKDSEADPICNGYTWVSTIMQFHDNHNVLFMSPGAPDSVGYEVFRVE